MWVNRPWMMALIAERDRLLFEWHTAHAANERLVGEHLHLRQQKSKDDVTIDWMRHRVNALEKINAQLLLKATGIHVPIPEIVPTRPGTLSDPPLDMTYMPSFEDVGDSEAQRLGVEHENDGTLVFRK